MPCECVSADGLEEPTSAKSSKLHQRAPLAPRCGNKWKTTMRRFYFHLRRERELVADDWGPSCRT